MDKGELLEYQIPDVSFTRRMVDKKTLGTMKDRVVAIPPRVTKKSRWK